MLRGIYRAQGPRSFCQTFLEGLRTQKFFQNLFIWLNGQDASLELNNKQKGPGKRKRTRTNKAQVPRSSFETYQQGPENPPERIYRPNGPDVPLKLNNQALKVKKLAFRREYNIDLFQGILLFKKYRPLLVEFFNFGTIISSLR